MGRYTRDARGRFSGSRLTHHGMFGWLQKESDVRPGRQFEQLDLFRPARDLVDPSKTTPGDFHSALGNPERLARRWGQKLSEAKEPMAISYSKRAKKGPSLHDSIRENGIYWPVELTHSADSATPEINEGHHRTAVAHDLDPNYLVPVTHRERPTMLPKKFGGGAL